MSSTVQEILTAIKEVLANLDGVQVYDFVPNSPNTPCLAVYAERFPYAEGEEATIIVWCISGTIEMQGAQQRLMDWFAETGPQSIPALIDSSSQLSGVVSSVLPLEMRTWSIDPVQEGRPRYVQGQLVLNVLR